MNKKTLLPDDPQLVLIKTIEKYPRAATAIYAAVIEGGDILCFDLLPDSFEGQTVTIILLKNDTLDFLVSANSNITLDIDGKVLIQMTDGIGVIAGATLSIKDSKGTGIVRTTSISSFDSAVIFESGKYELEEFGYAVVMGIDNIQIRGGTFNIDPTDFVATGFHVLNNGNETWTVVAD